MTKSCLSLVTALFLLGVRGATAQDAQYAEALRAAKARRYEAALAGLKAIAREWPAFDRAYRAMAAAAVASGAVEEVRAELEARRRADAGTVYADYALGELWLAQGNNPLAEQAAMRAIEAAPQFVPSYDTWVRAMRAQGKLTQAQSWLREQIGRDSSNPALHHALGVSMLFQAKRREAIAHFDDALRLRPDLFESLYGSHLAHYDSQLYSETLTILDRMLALTRAEDMDWRYYIEGRRGVVLKDMGRYTTAVSLLEFATTTARDLGDVRRQSHFESQLATVYGRLGDYDKAFASANEVLDLAIALGDRLAQGRTYGQLARFHASVCSYHVAIGWFQRAIELARQTSDRGSEADQLKGLAEILAASGKPVQALERITSAIAITHTLENKWLQARYLIAKASIQRQLRQFREALDTLREAQALSTETEDAFGAAATALSVGELHLQLNATGEARRAVAQALDLARRSQAHEIEARALVAAGRLASIDGRHEEAIARYQAALTIGDESRSPELLWLAHRALAETHQAGRRLERASEHYRSAIAALERMRAGLGRAEDRAAFLTDRLDVYRQQVSVLVTLHHQQPRRGYDAEAFHYLERGRARSYLEMIGYSRGDRSSRSDPAALVRERQLQSQIAFHQSALIDAHAARRPRAVIADLQRELAKADEAYNLFLWEQGAQNSGSVQNLQPLELAAAQKQLGRRRALLAYSLGSRESLLFAVDADRLRVYRLPGAGDLEREITTLRAAIADAPAVARLSNFVVAARSLYRTLIQPAAALIQGKDELVIVADGMLHYLPFEVLLREMPSGSSRIAAAALPYLIRDRAVSYVPSMSVLAALELAEDRRARIEDVTLLAYGDPSYTSGPGRTMETRSFFDGTAWTVGELPHSRHEVETIAGVFSPSRVTLRTRAQATETALKSDASLSEYHVLHFAVHGLMHAERPSLSGLVLSLPKTAADEAREDGLLQAYEIVNLKLHADLVVLSACETGLGKQLPGEGLVGLTQAFMYAGAGAVAGSLWKVADASSADLMLQFYRRLRAGSNFARALREAKLEQIQGGKYAHPYHWAGFVLAGRNFSLAKQ